MTFTIGHCINGLNTKLALLFELRNVRKLRVVIMTFNAFVSWCWGCPELVLQGLVYRVPRKTPHSSGQQLLTVSDPLYHSPFTVLFHTAAVSTTVKLHTYRHGLLIF